MLQTPVRSRQCFLQQDGQGERKPGVGHQVSSHVCRLVYTVVYLFICSCLLVGVCLGFVLGVVHQVRSVCSVGVCLFICLCLLVGVYL